ncbi:hypothetical protein Q5424_04840 [Conexibacter sp. JD483]|uniref:hypothetical protein n=1 Tax=unclassified Conexibacter TaxID=2627773 RepID=UPI00271F732A|nr:MULTISPECIES: hypothetical protein [unclassified Conexibacter]MDO8184659.1 hypothetical protein [Conexibacter sp. CPCC 205706]MDO8197965.1 hypothetical protein [Conexibacter sp. CPCC 205762]MDR9368395.1 hypothetical protein [Conexibacter sp. JD483]
MGNDRTNRDGLRTCACKANDFASARAALVRRLAHEVAELGGRPTVGGDSELFDVLLGLYDRSPDEIWSEVVSPWLDARDSKLQLVYAEHQALADDTRLLDQPHAPMLLERLEHDRARVIERWPYAISELEALQDVWGIRLLL